MRNLRRICSSSPSWGVAEPGFRGRISWCQNYTAHMPKHLDHPQVSPHPGRSPRPPGPWPDLVPILCDLLSLHSFLTLLQPHWSPGRPMTTPSTVPHQGLGMCPSLCPRCLSTWMHTTHLTQVSAQMSPHRPQMAFSAQPVTAASPWLPPPLCFILLYHVSSLTSWDHMHICFSGHCPCSTVKCKLKD